jgi:methionyl-tRNA formyltransferase
MTHRIVFMGNPEWAMVVLRSLHAAGHEIREVYTAPDKPAGRGKKMTPPPVKRLARELHLPVMQPASMKSEEAAAGLKALNPEFIIVVAYGLMLPRAVLDIPRFGCLNLHFSLLPKWRGAAPVQRSLMAGETETGVTVMQLDAGLDTGPIVLQERVTIGREEDANALGLRLAALGGPLLGRAMAGLHAGTLQPQPQGAGATHAAKLTKEEASLDWHLPAGELFAKIRGLSLWPVAEMKILGQRVKILKAELAAAAEPVAPGEVKVLSGHLFAGTGDSLALELLEVKPEGKRAMSGAEFARGSRERA